MMKRQMTKVIAEYDEKTKVIAEYDEKTKGHMVKKKTKSIYMTKNYIITFWSSD